MSRDYYFLNNYKNNGKMGISRRSFETIATTAANGVKDAKVSRQKSRLFHLAHPVNAYFRNDGKVELQIDVNISGAAPVKDVCLKIQEAVASSVSMMCETVPFGIEIKVISVR